MRRTALLKERGQGLESASRKPPSEESGVWGSGSAAVALLVGRMEVTQL